VLHLTAFPPPSTAMQNEADAQEIQLSGSPLPSGPVRSMLAGADQDAPFHRKASPPSPTAMQNKSVAQDAETAKRSVVAILRGADQALLFHLTTKDPPAGSEGEMYNPRAMQSDVVAHETFESCPLRPITCCADHDLPFHLTPKGPSRL